MIPLHINLLSLKINTGFLQGNYLQGRNAYKIKNKIDFKESAGKYLLFFLLFITVINTRVEQAAFFKKKVQFCEKNN